MDVRSVEYAAKAPVASPVEPVATTPLPTVNVRAFMPKDVDHVEYAASQPPPNTQVQTSVPPPPVAPIIGVQTSSGWAPEELAQIRAESPERIPYQRADSRRAHGAPPGYHYESHLRHPFWIVGASLMLTAVVADVMALTLDNGKSEENATAAAVVSIIGFGAGIPMLIYGLIPVKAYVRNDLGWYVRPTIFSAHASVTGGGFAAGISF